MQASRSLTRRQFLLLGAAATTLGLAACSQPAPASPTTAPKPAATTAPAPAATTAPAAPAATAAPVATAAPAAGPTKGGTVTIARDQEPDKLVNNWTPMTVAFEVSVMVLDSLITYNDKAEFVPFLAKEVPTVENGGISKDGLTYTFRLRNDVKWHDGAPFTAKDVLFTVSVTNDPNNGARFPLPIKSASAPDDYTVVFTLQAPNVGLLSRFVNFQPLPQHVLKDVKDWKTAEYFSKPYPGTGAYKFVEWQRGNYITVERNPNYYKAPVNLDKIVYRVIPNDDARLAALKTGEADMSFYLIGQHVDLAKQIAGNTVTETPSFSAFFFIFNLRDPLLKDVRTRQALNYALDREGIVKNVIKGLGSPKYSPIPKASPAYAEPKTRYNFDVAKAKALLDQVGWKETTPGGVREAKGVAGVSDGTKLAFTVNNITGQAERLLVCQVAQQQWKAIGAQMDINAVDVAGYVAANNSFKFTMSYGYLGVMPEPTEMGQWWQVKVGSNWHGLDTVWPEIDDVFAKAAATLDKTERFKILADYQEKMMQLATDAFVYDRVFYDAVKTKVQNFKPGPSGTQTWNAYEWWIKG